MAKKKTLEQELADVLTSGDELKEREKTLIKLTPSLNIGLGGGIQSGTITTLASKDKFGKTATALYIAGQAQKKEYATEDCPDGRPIWYHNAEMRLKPRDLNIAEIDTSKGKFNTIESKKGNILTAEKHLTKCERIINEKPGSIVLFDSLTFLVSDTEMSSDMEDQSRATQAKLLYKFFRRVLPVIPVNDIIFIAIVHKIANPSGMGASSNEASGNAIKFAVENKLIGTYSKPWLDGDDEIGKEMQWKVYCSSLAKPGPKLISWLRYNYGVDKEKELLQVGCDLGIVCKAGSWIKFDEDNKVQGEEKACAYLRNNPDLYKEIYEKIKQLIPTI